MAEPTDIDQTESDVQAAHNLVARTRIQRATAELKRALYHLSVMAVDGISCEAADATTAAVDELKAKALEVALQVAQLSLRATMRESTHAQQELLSQIVEMTQKTAAQRAGDA